MKLLKTWTAGLLLAAVASGQTATRVRVDVSERLHELSPLLHGHFAEFMFENIKGGLRAELLRNRGFENSAPLPSASHYWERHPDNRNHDVGLFIGGERFGISEAGYPSVAPGRALVLLCVSEDRRPRGVYQNDIPVRAGVEYRGSIWLRAAGLGMDRRSADPDLPFSGTVRVSLEENASGGEVYASRDIDGIGLEWRKFDFSLPARNTDLQARFVIQIFGAGVLWADQVSLMPGDAEGSVRADVLSKIDELKPAFLRWPGGNVAQDYHWTWGVGPRDARPTWVNMSWDDDPEPADFGTAEYVAFCRRVGAEPTLVVNVEGRGVTLAEADALRASGRDIRVAGKQADAEEAAAWVEYCNGPPTSRYGALRARHGYPEPFGVKYWEIGNEIWGDWVRGHSDASTYAANARRYIRAMKAVDPSIRIIAVGWEEMDWNRVVLREIGDEIDYLSIHHYYGSGSSPGERANIMARPLRYERLYEELKAVIGESAPGRDIKLAVNEWNTSLPPPRQHSMESGLFAARLLNVFERQGDVVAMTSVSDLVNGWPGGIIQAGRRRVFTTPTYSVIAAYNRLRGRWSLRTEVEGSPTYNPEDESLGRNVPAVDVVASLSEDGDEVYVKIVNTALDTDLRIEIEIVGGRQAAPEAELTTISGPTIEAANTFSEPNTVGPKTTTITTASNRFSLSAAKGSVTIATLKLR